MGFGSLFKVPQHNVFDYKPRYYDPEKDRRRELLNEMRVSQGKEAIGFDSSKPGARIKGSFKHQMRRSSYSKGNSALRVLVLTFVLGFLAYLILIADLTPIVKLFMK
ncbi:MAG: hypothetical protein GX793_08735 [Bacteroidales bacterium]|jgi:hypothetical protein|nr:hypothetical protein [Bacteroidales bacterium]MCK9498198.1 hypothetical protein [Bacteroidales bacterium]MDY0313631.1 hypothetical protein [Bacteroidales bacterium]NLB87131.1 hypothetical protein [Bacteroidales bacterium]